MLLIRCYAVRLEVSCSDLQQALFSSLQETRASNVQVDTTTASLEELQRSSQVKFEEMSQRTDIIVKSVKEREEVVGREYFPAEIVLILS